MADNKEQEQTAADLMSYHLSEFIRLKLADTHCSDEKQNQFWEEARKFPPMPFVDQKTFGVLLTLELDKLETKGVIWRKKMPDGSIRVYDVIEHFLQCCGTVDQWKQCPENDCVLNDMIERCPHFPSIVNPSYCHPITVGLDKGPIVKKNVKEDNQNK